MGTLQDLIWGENPKFLGGQRSHNVSTQGEAGGQRKRCDSGSRYWSGVATNQEMQEPYKLKKARILPCGLKKEHNPASTLIWIP
jgi:hypothetical protein